MDITEKLEVLSQDSRYDLACACAPRPDEHRRRSPQQKWIYPVSLPNGGTTFLFKILLSNTCRNNCKYCPLRSTNDRRRLSLKPYELARTFLEYYRKRRVSGLFLSSAVETSSEATMGRINQAAEIVRRSGFRGYMHLKIIPGASPAAIRHTLSLASAASLNIEIPGQENFRLLAQEKDYHHDILNTIDYIGRLRLQREPARRPHQTTQFIVGAAAETDQQIISQSASFYKRLRLNRVYFSAYQRGTGAADIPGEHSRASNTDLLTREHRLYQADWLLRKYGFGAEEIIFDQSGNLSLEYDPKEAWARKNPQFFPVNINKDDQYRLLRVPGLGQVAVGRILSLRKEGVKIRSLECLGRQTKLLKKANQYVTF